jgi:hypothetical protein
MHGDFRFSSYSPRRLRTGRRRASTRRWCSGQNPAVSIERSSFWKRARSWVLALSQSWRSPWRSRSLLPATIRTIGSWRVVKSAMTKCTASARAMGALAISVDRARSGRQNLARTIPLRTCRLPVSDVGSRKGERDRGIRKGLFERGHSFPIAAITEGFGDVEGLVGEFDSANGGVGKHDGLWLALAMSIPSIYRQVTWLPRDAHGFGWNSHRQEAQKTTIF